jgi:uncharacterized protein
MEKNFIDQNYIEVTGKAEMQIVPDLIGLKILLSEKDLRNKVSMNEMEKKMNDKFQEIGIDVKKDLSVGDLVSSLESKLLSKNEIILSKEYRLIVHDAKTAGKVLVELEKLGVSNVSVSLLDHSKMKEYRKEIKINAIKVAKDHAMSLAQAIEQSIGRAIYIQDIGSAPIEMKYEPVGSSLRRRASYQIDLKQEVELDFDKIELNHSILVRFELK